MDLKDTRNGLVQLWCVTHEVELLQYKAEMVQCTTVTGTSISKHFTGISSQTSVPSTVLNCTHHYYGNHPPLWSPLPNCLEILSLQKLGVSKCEKRGCLKDKRADGRFLSAIKNEGTEKEILEILVCRASPQPQGKTFHSTWQMCSATTVSVNAHFCHYLFRI